MPADARSHVDPFRQHDERSFGQLGSMRVSPRVLRRKIRLRQEGWDLESITDAANVPNLRYGAIPRTRLDVTHFSRILVPVRATRWR